MNKDIYTQAQNGLIGQVMTPSARAGLVENLQASGARTVDATLDVAAAAEWLGDDFARERLLAVTPGLPDVPKDKVVFAGGACAVDPLRSSGLARNLVFDPETGAAERVTSVEEVCQNLLGPITLAQALDVVGQTPGRTIAVAETELWTDKVVIDMGRQTVERDIITKASLPVDESDRALVRATIQNMNKRIIGAAEGIRQLLYPGASPIVAVEDTQVLPELIERTYALYRDLGLPIDEDNTAIPVLGMYTAAWRETLRGQGIVNDDDVLAVYEPSRHMVVVKTNARKTAMVQTMLARYPYLAPGFNEQVGVLAYTEGLLPNGLAFSSNVPVAFQPNSANVGSFDFSRYPQVTEQKGKGAEGTPELRFLEKLGNLDLLKNPAFLWAVTVFPPTPELTAAVREMLQITAACSKYVDTSRKEGNWQVLSDREKNALSAYTREQASQEMQAAAERVIGILEDICAAVFGKPKAKKGAKR